MAYITIMNTKQNGDTFYSVELCMGCMTAKAMESEAVFLWIELLTKGEVDANNASKSLTQNSETFLLLVHYTAKL